MESNRELSKFLVFYGFARLTKKARRKKSIIIQYANTTNYNDRQERYIKQQMTIVYQRFQTIEEAADAEYSNRSWTKYEYFVDDKKWKGNLEAILQHNFVMEQNNVSLEERTLIMEKLREKYKWNYMEFLKIKSIKNGNSRTTL